MEMSAVHARDAASDYEGRLVYLQIKFLQRLELASTRYRHADDILCLFSGFLFFFLVDPGVVLPDVRHLVVVLVDPRFTHCVAEEWFKGSGRAGSNNHAIEAFFLGDVGYLLGRVGGA